MISVIVPIYNAAPYLAAALESIFVQQVERLDVVVVDGGSDDGSLDTAASFPQVRVIHQQGRGLADARNAGVAAVHGDLLAFLDADDYWPPDRLAVQSAYLARTPACQAVVGRFIRFLQTDVQLPPRYVGDWLERPTLGYTPGALLARRRVFERVGAFDVTFTVGCDSDWFMRARDAGVEFVELTDVVLYKRIHEANLSAQVECYRRELLTLTRRSLQRRGHFSHPPASP